jgi:hypothetical protein
MSGYATPGSSSGEKRPWDYSSAITGAQFRLGKYARTGQDRIVSDTYSPASESYDVLHNFGQTSFLASPPLVDRDDGIRFGGYDLLTPDTDLTFTGNVDDSWVQDIETTALTADNTNPVPLVETCFGIVRSSQIVKQICTNEFLVA